MLSNNPDQPRFKRLQSFGWKSESPALIDVKLIKGTIFKMLEKPEIEENQIITCLQSDYGLIVAELTFLPLGADQNTAVFRIAGRDNHTYFLKLRKEDFNEASVTIPYFLSQSGMRQVVPPIATQNGNLWSAIKPLNAILYPFIEGQHGFESKLSKAQWIEFGAALKQFHTTNFPPGLTDAIPQENFSSHWRDNVKKFYERFGTETIFDPAAVELASFMESRESETLDLINRTEQYANFLKNHPLPFILCHADIHGWNLLIDDQGELYIVDWDTLVFAPKERDLMFIGSGPGDSGYTPQEEEAMFYQGYGPTALNQTALTYYRYERIIEDLAVYCDQIFNSDQGGKDRQAAVENVKSNYRQKGTIEKAMQADKGS